MSGSWAVGKVTHGILSESPLGMITKGIITIGVEQGTTESIRRGGNVTTKSESSGKRVNKEIQDNKYWIRVNYEKDGKKYSYTAFHNNDIKVKGTDVNIEFIDDKPKIEINGLEKLRFYPDVKITT